MSEDITNGERKVGTDIVNCTIADNTATTEAGGLRNCDGTTTIANCIIWGNDPCQLVDSSTPTYSCFPGASGNGNISADPDFVDPCDPCEPDYHIQPISPCIDEGDPCDPCEPYDIDGESRVFNGTVDMGADEFNGVIYVDADATSGNNNGGSWANAYLDLQDALDAAGSGVKIWVAEGTYYPTDGSTRTISFELKSGVDVYGGFDPCSGDDLWSERDWAGNVTILSGDIDDQGTDDSYHVVLGADNATLDGFTITKGKASGFPPNNGGGGMYNDNVSPTVANCIFDDNRADGGGGMHIKSCSPTITDCTFDGNYADNHGGGLYIHAGNPEIEDCCFKSNQAGIEGGAIFTSLCQATFTGCDIGDTLPNLAPYGSSSSAEIYTFSTYVPCYNNCTIRGGLYGSYCDDGGTEPNEDCE